MYSRGKQELEKERKQQQQLKKTIEKAKPEDLIKLADPITRAAEKTKRTLEATNISLDQLRQKTDSLKQVGDITNEIHNLKVEVAELKDLVKALIVDKKQNIQQEAVVLAKLRESLENAAIDQL